MEWSMRIFGSMWLRDMATDHALTLLSEPESPERSKFMFTNVPPIPIPDVVEDYDTGAAAVGESELSEISDVVPPRAAPITSQMQIPLSSNAGSGAGGSALQQGSGTVEFVSPLEVFGPLKPVGSITNNPGLVSSSITQLPLPSHSPVLVQPPVLDSRQVAAPRQVAAVLGSLLDASSQTQTPKTIIPHQPAISPATTQTHHLGFSEVGLPDQASTSIYGSTADTQITQAVQPTGPDPEVAGGTYKVRKPGKPVGQTRRDSIEGAPDVTLTLGGSGYELPEQSDVLVASPVATPSTSAPPATPTPPLDDIIVPSSQQSLEEGLTIPPEISAEPALPLPQQTSEGRSRVIDGMSRFAPRIVPEFQMDRSDFPSWFSDRKRLDAVLEVAGGGLWEKLICLWLRQERRLAFGLNEAVVG